MSKHSEDKKKAIKIVTECAIKYKRNLLDRSLLFVCTDKHKHVSVVELKFEAGNIQACLGMKQLRDGSYIAQTALKGDTRNFIRNPLQIIITYSKFIKEQKYADIVRVSKSKKVDWSKIRFPEGYEYLPRPEQMLRSQF